MGTRAKRRCQLLPALSPGKGRCWAASAFSDACSPSALAWGASGASVGQPAPGRQPTLPSSTVRVMRDSSSSPVRQTSCCGQVSPTSNRNLCVSWKRYEDRVGEKMLEAGPDPLNYASGCLWGQRHWRDSNPPYRSPAWQICAGRAQRAGASAARRSPGHIPEGWVWLTDH